WPRDWSSDVCSSDLNESGNGVRAAVDTEATSANHRAGHCRSGAGGSRTIPWRRRHGASLIVSLTLTFLAGFCEAASGYVSPCWPGPGSCGFFKGGHRGAILLRLLNCFLLGGERGGHGA